MKLVSQSQLSLYSDRVFKVPVSLNQITFESEFPIMQPESDFSYLTVGDAIFGEEYFDNTYKKDVDKAQ
jgi:hypothetical protein